MNKKMMSFVLAMVLSVGLGVGSAFAGAYSDYASEFSSAYEGRTSSGSVTVKIGETGDNLGGKITATFGYFAGSMVSYQGAGGNFQIYDSYGARFSVSTSGGEDGKPGTWTLNGVNLRTTDLDKMEGKTAEKFLMDMGFTASSLEMAKLNEEGEMVRDENNNLVKTTDISAAWFDKMKSELKAGTNHSVSVQAGSGVTGPTLTVSQNGKTMASYVSDESYSFKKEDGTTVVGLRPTALYIYDDKGFQVGVQQATFEFDNSGDQTASGHWTTNYTATTYDANGVRTDTTYKFDTFAGNPEAYLSESLAKGSGVTKISQTMYSANNTALYTKDFTTNNTTYYANNRASYAVNDQGTTTEVYKYTENGVIQASFSLNADGDNSNGNKVGTLTLYDQWGRQMLNATGNADMFNDQKTRERLLKEREDSIKNGGFATANFTQQSDGTYKPNGGTTITNVYIYLDDIIPANSNVVQNGSINMNAVYNLATSQKGLQSIFGTAGNGGNPLSGFGFDNADIINMLRFSNGNNVPLASINIAHSSWSGDKDLENYRDVDDKSNGTKNVTETVGYVTKSMGTHDWHSVVGAENAGSRTVKNGISYNCTVLLGGAQAYSFSKAVITETINIQSVNAIVESDPAVEGTLWPSEDTTEEEIVAMAEKLGIDTNDEKAMADLRNGFYTASDGQTYAIVSANSIHVMDGSEEGFHSVKGETILVAVDNTTKNTIINNVKASGDRSIMFMGDVRESASESSTGYFTMTMNTSYGGGYVQGSEAVEAAKIEIAETSAKVASAKYAYDNGDMSEEEFNKIKEEAGWIGENTVDNLNKFAQANFSWDNSKNTNVNLEDAWEALKANF